jgi:hypothetical protein
VPGEATRIKNAKKDEMNGEHFDLFANCLPPRPTTAVNPPENWALPEDSQQLFAETARTRERQNVNPRFCPLPICQSQEHTHSASGWDRCWPLICGNATFKRPSIGTELLERNYQPY